jgi:hypothetical protein
MSFIFQDKNVQMMNMKYCYKTKVCTPVSSINKTDCHDITEILLKVALNTIPPSLVHHAHLFVSVCVCLPF